MKGIYLAAFKADHPGYDIVYQDINGKRDLAGDMMDVDLTPYDFIIASPPCNFWSRANYRRDISEYSQKTKHLLPSILNKLYFDFNDKPWIVENVFNFNLMNSHHLFDLPVFVYKIGRHTYWSNIMFNPDIIQELEHITKIGTSKRQGGLNVHRVIETFLEVIH